MPWLETEATVLYFPFFGLEYILFPFEFNFSSFGIIFLSSFFLIS